MDNNNWRPPQVGEPPIDAGDWRSQLQPDSRQRIVNKITDTLKRHLPFSGQEGLQEMVKIAVRFEEKIYIAATSQSDYLRKISLKMLTMETKSQHSMANPSQSNSADSTTQTGQAIVYFVPGTMLQPQNVMDQQNQLYQSQRALPEASSNSTTQTGHATGGDWQEEVFQKIKFMKEMYLPELSEMYQKIATKLQQHDSLPQQPQSEQLDKLKMFRTMLERLISILQISKSSISPGLKDKLFFYEKQMVNFISVYRPTKPVSSLHQWTAPTAAPPT